MARRDDGAVELSPDQVLYQMLWSRKAAARWLRLLGVDHFAGITTLGAPIAAVIDDHDRTHPDAPADGPERVVSIVDHARWLADDVRAHPDYYADAAQGINARSAGEVDRLFLRHAPAVVRRLPVVAVVGEPREDDEDEPGATPYDLDPMWYQ